MLVNHQRGIKRPSLVLYDGTKCQNIHIFSPSISRCLKKFQSTSRVPRSEDVVDRENLKFDAMIIIGLNVWYMILVRMWNMVSYPERSSPPCWRTRSGWSPLPMWRIWEARTDSPPTTSTSRHTSRKRPPSRGVTRRTTRTGKEEKIDTTTLNKR